MLKNYHFNNSNKFSSEIHDLIPGGSHRFSKRDDQFPINASGAITHGKGAYIWDVDGNEFIDCSMGLTSVSIGHGYQPVAHAEADVAFQRTIFQSPALIEPEAVKLVRAFTGRNRVAICREHNFFSFDGWFIVRKPCYRL